MISFKKIFLMCCLILIILLTAACNPKDIEEYMKDVKSTNLLGENIDSVEIGMIIADKTFQEKYGNPQEDDYNNHYLLEGRKYDQYWIDQLLLGVDRETKEILSVGFLSNNHESSSLKGIKLGDSIEKVISTYGDNFYTYRDNEQSIYIIGYVDHPNNLTLSFVHYNDVVTGISLGYAFDRLKWG